jgi:hypothetical protein
MSVFAPINDKLQSKIQGSQYIETANQQDEADTKPAEPVSPTEPETK